VLEKLNLELKRRTKRIGAFPSEQFLLRLIIVTTMDIDEELTIRRRYMKMEENYGMHRIFYKLQQII